VRAAAARAFSAGDGLRESRSRGARFDHRVEGRSFKRNSSVDDA
jgi:hypothetical protein